MMDESLLDHCMPRQTDLPLHGIGGSIVAHYPSMIAAKAMFSELELSTAQVRLPDAAIEIR
jgi:hypothetical protein